ncbi:hypothetical protein C1H46_010812 [Malus baccata]|uniref:Uncharacterized protein n=1 Tax=Malus baccata TaxID=106549 RepID=A0A540MXJ2_MALBA|nr:hypothetical protein C1H46_010812 [Malus baccata]
MTKRRKREAYGERRRRVGGGRAEVVEQNTLPVDRFLHFWCFRAFVSGVKLENWVRWSDKQANEGPRLFGIYTSDKCRFSAWAVQICLGQCIDDSVF